MLADIGDHLPATGKRIHLSTVRTGGSRAVQTEQAFHDAHLHNTDDGTAFIATQFHVGVFNDGDNARYNSHQ